MTGSGSADAEWLIAADEYLIRVYRYVMAHPDNPSFTDPTGQVIPAFITAAEDYLKQSRQWPLKDML
jgi:hypothetical protein